MVETLNANVPLEKTRIIGILKQKGPSVANAIARTLELPNILTSAILSEMASDKVVKISYLKIGGSPLYYLPGQELVLENFTSHLELKEKEAFSKLKESGILIDSELDPAIRVAFRNMKDYAVPLKVRVNNEDKIVWKYYMLNNVDGEVKLNELFEQKEEKQEQKAKEVVKEVKKIEKIEKPAEKKEEKAEKPKIREKTEKKAKTDIKGLTEKWLSNSSSELKKELLVKNKEASFVISSKSGIGMIDFLLVVKDKKALNEADLAMAYKEGMNQKLPVIVLSKGKPSKKLLEYAETFGGHLILRDFEGNF
jgi:hypothetical protein